MTFILNNLSRNSLVSTDNTYNDVSNKVFMHPNPGYGHYTLEVPMSFVGANAVLNFYDINGNRVLSNFINVIGEREPIDITIMASCMYSVV